MGYLSSSLAWCLPTGLNTPITYFYLVFFVILLLHRQIRDDEACREKYGSDWEKYCEKVPYRIIPYVVSLSVRCMLSMSTVVLIIQSRSCGSTERDISRRKLERKRPCETWKRGVEVADIG